MRFAKAPAYTTGVFRMRRPFLPFLLIGMGCTQNSQEPAAPEKASPFAGYDRVSRKDFNTWAVKLDIPVFWAVAGKDLLTPEQIVPLMGGPGLENWTRDGQFTEAFAEAYARILQAATEGLPGEKKLDPAERRRRARVRKELDQGQPTLIGWDMTGFAESDRILVREILAAAEWVETIYAKQKGVHEMAARVQKLDPASRALFERNQEPACLASETENDPDCTALPDAKRVWGLYPAELQKEPGFCERLSRRDDAEALLSPFTVVRKTVRKADGDGKDLEAVPYSEAYRTEAAAITRHLRTAADAQPESEKALAAYLRAAAQAFEDNDWFAADEAWSRMSARNSAWYLRIGPDEVYFEPCNRKAGFHVSFARINPDSLAWQDKLEPVKQDMEDVLADMAGKPYRARKVTFQLPDFIDIVLNAGDSRNPRGATIGQSLPNWGPVANEGRGRTVAMSNLYTDADSQASLTSLAESLLCKDTIAHFSADKTPQIMSTVLHEAAHNLGPSHEYRVKGKTDDEIFGGPMASTMEELKAQTSAMFLAHWLAEKEILSKDQEIQAHVRDLTWMFSHISRGMYDASDRPRPYSHLSAIQLGSLMDAGAVTWRVDERAANGTDEGCFSMDLQKLPAAVQDLEARVLRIKGAGLRDQALALRAKYVDGDERQATLNTIRQRWLRAPKPSFVYSIRF